MGTEEYSTTSDQQGELDRSRLLLAMTHVLNLEELHTACFDLGIEYDDLPPGGRIEKARDFILYCERYGRIDDLLDLLKRIRPHTDWENVYRPWATGESPFKGLAYYDVADTYLFFGREALTAELVEDLRENRFLAIVGASGSGKSSLVRAGLIPTLQGVHLPDERIRLPDGSCSWPVHIITPTAHPLETLSISLTRDAESTEATEILISDLERSPRSLHLYVRKLLASGDHSGNSGNPSSRLLLVVDQFEELFTQCHSEKERQSFIANLMTAIDPELDGPTVVVIVLRADFYGHCANYDEIRLALANRQKYIGQMSVDELRRAIEEPARVQNLTFEEELVDQMLRDVGVEADQRPEPGALPLLSHALLETWKRRDGNMLSLAGYYNAGGVSGAIALTANNTYFSLPPEQQVIARNVFLRLTELGDSTLDTRRRASLDELVLRKSEVGEVAEVLKILADARLITTSENETEVAHESLIREWPVLRNWLDEDREGHRLHQRLMKNAIEWQANDRDPSYLYRGARLAAAEDWLEGHEDILNEIEASFVEACSAKEQERMANLQAQAEAERIRADREAKASRNFKILSAVLFGLLGIAAASFGIAYSRQQVVDAQRLAFASQSQVSTAPETALLLAIEAARRIPEFQSEQAMRAALEAFTWRPTTLNGHEDRVYTAEISPDGQYALTASKDGTARLWNTDGSPLVAFQGHDGEVLSALYSADGRRILTASDDGTARLWNLNGETLVTYKGHDDSLRSGIFSPNEQFVLTASDDGTARLWDIDGTQLQLFEGHDDAVVKATFNPDSQLVLTASKDGTARLWDLEGNMLAQYDGHEAYLRNAIFSPDGQQVLTVSNDGMARIWDLDAELIAEFIQTSYMRNAAFSPDGQYVVTIGGWDDEAQLCGLAGQPIVKFSGHTNTVVHVAFSPDGQRILTTSGDGTARLWDLQGNSLAVFKGHANAVPYASFGPDGRQIITASRDHTARIWEDIGPLFPIYEGHESNIEEVEFSPDGELLLTASDDKTARLWDLNGKSRVVYSGHNDEVGSATFSPEGKRILTASDDGTARLWDLTGEMLVTFEGHKDEVKSASFSPDGQLVLTGSYDGTARLWDLNSKQLMVFEGHDGEVKNTHFSPDGQQILTISDEGLGIVWDIDGNTIAVLKGHEDGVDAAAWSPDGQTVATCSNDLTCRLWDTEGRTLATLEGHEARIEHVAFSPDGRLIATASGDRTARLWDLEGNSVAILKGHSDAVEIAKFSPDGQFVLTTSRDNTARLWDLEGDEVAILRGHDNWLEPANFSEDGRTVVTGSRDGTARLHYVHLDDLLAEAACRVGRGLTELEIAQFGVGRPRFVFEERDCSTEQIP